MSVRSCRPDAKALIDPDSAERLRLLIAAMGIARGTDGSLAIATLAHRGYAVELPVRLGSGSASVHPIDELGLGCLPGRTRAWRDIERHALAIEPAMLPPCSFVSAHMAVRIRQELRSSGFDFNFPGAES